MKYSIFFSSLIVCCIGSTVYAADPQLTSYTVTPSNLSSGQLVSVSWSADNSLGASLVVSCVPGVKVKKQDGSLFPCDSKTSVSSQGSDSIGLFIVNTSGSYKTVMFTVYPKDSAGMDTSVGQSGSVTVSPMPYPIASFSSSATSTSSGSGTLLSWSAPELDGVNFNIACVDGVSVSQDTNPAVLPCGQLMFSTKQAATGSMNLIFKNKNIDHAFVKVMILPYIIDGTYDQTHAESVTLDVGSEKITPFQIISFVATPPKVSSDDNTSLLWSTKYTNAVTLKMDCVEGVTASFVTSTSTTLISCGRIVSDVGYVPNASTTVSFLNTTSDIKSVGFTLYAQLPGGGFDGINTQKISIAVYPKGYVSEKVAVANIATQTQSNTTVKKFIFTKLLKLGVRNSDVTELQKFLAKDPVLYPEASVSGYFGPATQKAVRRFQVKYGLVKSGEAGYGQVGPKTREKLNVVQ